MEDEDRGGIFESVRYTIIPSDELDDEQIKLVWVPNTDTVTFADQRIATRQP